MIDPSQLDEYDIRKWFKIVELAQARDTFRVVEGILEMREASVPRRKKRSDAGKPRSASITEQQANDGTYEQPDLAPWEGK